MTAAAVMMPATTWLPKANPRWYYQRVTPRLTSEGDEVVLAFYVLNWNVGSCIAPWFTGGKSLAAAGNWERNWHDVFLEACEANGCSYRRLSSSTTPPSPGGTLAGLITIGEGYRGQTILLRNRSRRNRRTDATNADGTPGFREMQILMSVQGASGSAERAFNGTLAPFVGGNTVQVLDTSRRPEGAPTLRLRLLAPDGTNSPTNLLDGGRFRVLIETANMVPGTKLKLYAANDAQKDTSPGIQTAIERGAKAAGCTAFTPSFNRDGAAAYYRGGEITFTDAYTDAAPIDMPMTIDAKSDAEGTRPLDFIALITFEGDAAEFDSTRGRGDWASGISYRRGDFVTYLQDGGTYIYIEEASSSGHAPTDANYWRPYRRIQTSTMGLSIKIRVAPPRFWEVRATSDGSTITYRLQAPTGAIGDSVALASVGAPAGFDTALASACGLDAPIGWDGTRLTARATDRATSSVTFTVPHAGAGKHGLRLSDPSGASPIVIGDACVFLTAPMLPAEQSFNVGINLAGGEFDSDNAPGTYGTNYAYPNQAELDYWVRKGAGIIRLPVRWERIQDGLFGPLSGADGTGPISGRQDTRRIDAFIAAANAAGLIVLIDIHNYMAFKPIGRVGYDKPVPPAALVDICVRVAERYAGAAVWLGIMNEPSGDGATAQRTADNMQWATNGVRARTDFRGKVLVAGYQFSSARNWVSNGQAAAFASFYDPAGNFAFEPHCYFDEDASGTSGACVVGSHTRLVAITEWARANGRKLFLGELAGSGTDTVCQDVLPAAYRYMRDNPDAWIGWTTWGGGRRWGASYAFRLDPLDYQAGDDTPALRLLLPFLGAVA